jgi:hypothetical protein
MTTLGVNRLADDVELEDEIMCGVTISERTRRPVGVVLGLGTVRFFLTPHRASDLAVVLARQAAWAAGTAPLPSGLVSVRPGASLDSIRRAAEENRGGI